MSAILDQLKAHALQDQESCAVEAELKLGCKPRVREYGVGAQMLADLGVRKMRLMADNPTRIVGLEGYGLEVVEQVPIGVEAC